MKFKAYGDNTTIMCFSLGHFFDPMLLLSMEVPCVNTGSPAPLGTSMTAKPLLLFWSCSLVLLFREEQ